MQFLFLLSLHDRNLNTNPQKLEVIARDSTQKQSKLKLYIQGQDSSFDPSFSNI